MILVALLEIELVPRAIIARGIFCWNLNNCELMMFGEEENFPRVGNLHQPYMELHKSSFLKAGPWKIAYKTGTA